MAPTQKRNRPRQARSQARVELILETTRDLLRELGYKPLTTTMIADRAGIRLIFFDPVYRNSENRSRRMNSALGTNCAMTDRMVSDPRNNVS